MCAGGAPWLQQAARALAEVRAAQCFFGDICFFPNACSQKIIVKFKEVDERLGHRLEFWGASKRL